MSVASKDDEILFLLNKLTKNTIKSKCCICMIDTTDRLFLCDHAIHMNCMTHWLIQSNNYCCPTCEALLKHSYYSKLYELVERIRDEKVVEDEEEEKVHFITLLLTTLIIACVIILIIMMFLTCLNFNTGPHKIIYDAIKCKYLSDEDLLEISFIELHTINNVYQIDKSILENEQLLKINPREVEMLKKFYNIAICKKLMLDKPIGRYSIN